MKHTSSKHKNKKKSAHTRLKKWRKRGSLRVIILLWVVVAVLCAALGNVILA